MKKRRFRKGGGGQEEERVREGRGDACMTYVFTCHAIVTGTHWSHVTSLSRPRTRPYATKDTDLVSTSNGKRMKEKNTERMYSQRGIKYAYGGEAEQKTGLHNLLQKKNKEKNKEQILQS